ncbi:bifunctional lysylphosphatidylglycerol synthetase/lysine--tRNA ligase LysX [Antricoccus suffuscus]|uniref:bifunctional lysylphosphatidylglycerol synthetase/lysine--tRNA ligase LysX n=1 Tax=Antricoccus suffuscus TaxID=1629062 RepID=UPI000D04A136|nr:bifunctional lysylphosphatidylglycerol synthetase/lysine--tRNA ligase LysX [Antricoccus suffuscus]
MTQQRPVLAAVGSSAANRCARWVAVVYSFAALVSLTYWHHHAGFVQHFWPERFFGLFNVPMSESFFVGLLLFVLAGALLRHKRFALWIVLIFQALGVLRAILIWIGYVAGRPLPSWTPRVGQLFGSGSSQVLATFSGIFGIVIIVVLWRSRLAFQARRSPGSRRITALILAVGLSACVLLAVLLSLKSPGSLGQHLVFGLRVVFGINEEGLFLQSTHGPEWVADVIGWIAAAVMLVAAVVFLRSPRTLRIIDEDAELRVRRQLLTGHDDSLGYFATRRDKAVVFSPDGRASVTYRVLASVSIASADPIGPTEAWPSAIAAWLSEARTYGWVPAVLSASKGAAEAYVAAGLRAIPLGDEAIINVDTFRLTGPGMKGVRQAVSRLTREGYAVSIRRHRDIDPDELRHLAELAEQWRGDAPERGFSMALSRLGDPADGSCLMVVAAAPDGRPAGLLSFVPWGRTGVSLDLMRRSKNGPNGLVELMVTSLIGDAAAHGVRRISLNFAMFRRVFADADEFDAGPITRLNNSVLSVFSRFFQLETLYRSNAKYRPEWVPRYLCVDSPLSLPRVMIAAGAAEGFLPDPSTSRALTQKISSAQFGETVAAQESAALAATIPVRRLAQQHLMRRDDLAELRAAHMPPYPVAVPRTGSLDTLVDAPIGTELSVTGRVLSIRNHGGVIFAHLTEGGALLQLLLNDADLGRPLLRLWSQTVNRGDLVSATGIMAHSRTGERSLLVRDWAMAAKSLHPLPPAHSGLTDPERRARQRSLDLIVNPEARTLLADRSRAVRSLRDTLGAEGYAEVETPILQTVHGGASARPFRTHINAYGIDLSLRIAPELYLKRLIVGGMGPIFELGRNFRNEGVDATHNPEFTSLEAYLPYGDYDRMRELATELIQQAAIAVHGAPVALRPDPQTGEQVRVDLSGQWPVVTVHDAVSRACGRSITPDTPRAEVAGIAADLGIAVPDGASAGEVVSEIYERRVEPTTVSPTFYTDFPVETSPLTRPHRVDPRLAERWDLVAFGMELGTAYSELTDPIDQRARLTEQSLRAAAGDPEAMEIDEAFLTAIETGMPPTGGLGLGVDRIVMLLTGSPIRSILTFPFVRPTLGRLTPGRPTLGRPTPGRLTLGSSTPG